MTSRRQQNKGKVALAGMAGNVLEWYDFSVFGYFSDIIGDNFFAPNGKGLSSLIEAFAVFGLGYLARPFGAALIGKMGDKYGRKQAVESSIFLMAFSTFLMGCLPTYSMVGRLSTVLLILIRLLQGLSVGGQFISALVFSLERSNVSGWGFWGAVLHTTTSIGISLASAYAGVLRNYLTPQQLGNWGWRIPFWCGALGALPALYLKQFVEELSLDSSSSTPPESNEARNEINSHNVINYEMEEVGEKDNESDEAKDPLVASLSRSNCRALISVILINTLPSAAFYILFVWLAIYMTDIINPPIPHGFSINSINAILGGIGFSLLGGLTADWLGVKRYRIMMTISGVSLGIFSPLLLGYIGSNFGSTKNSVGITAFVIQLFLIALLTNFGGPLNPWMISKFPPKIRVTSTSIAYNISYSVWGGFSPLIATVLVDHVNNSAPGYFITFAAFLSLLGLWTAPNYSSFKPKYNANELNIEGSEDGTEPLLSET